MITMQKSNFLELVAKERTRQIVEKGYTSEHDDEHTDGSIADAAACYATDQTEYIDLSNLWPWNFEFFKKDDHDRKQQLIIAAAFINAEYDRIVREEQKDSRCRVCNYLASKDGNTWCALTGMPMDEDDARCEQYCLPPFEASEDNPLVDISLRMLKPRELYNAQGFRPDYIIDRTIDHKPITGTAQVRMVGNSVCPPAAEAIIRANQNAPFKTVPIFEEAA